MGRGYLPDVDSLWTGLGVVAVVVVVVLVLVALFLAYRLIRKHRQVNQPDTPMPTKVAYWLSLAYTVFPVDALPDPIYLDDIAVLTGSLIYVTTTLRKKDKD
ncbi:Protein of unknown function [Actinokineospora terrae]|uniref:DUF1232 domain-containing protein n=1 Tax=Actinokineospora terrae TaxID=155974 RepID=A0A1H9N2V6_9PSEU|nr:Protein of unknown function [Actinokineospora terrae]